MKKFFTAFLTIIISFSIVFGCIAGYATENRITINPPSLDPITETLNITGYIETNRGSIPLVLCVEKGEETVEAQQIISAKASNGKSEFSFTPIPFNSDTLSGLYQIMVSADYIGSSKTIEYNYIGIDKRFNAINAVVDAKNSADDMLKAVEDYYDVFAIDTKVLGDMSDDAKAVLAKHLIKDTYVCPENYTDEGNADIISENISLFVSNYNKYMIIAQVIDVSDEGTLKTWIDDYAMDVGFYLDVAETEYDENDMAENYFDKIEKESVFIGRINKIAKEAENFAELKDEVLRMTLLTYIETSNYTKTKQIAEAFPELFDIFTSEFNTLSSYKQSVVYKDVTGEYWETIEAFCDAVEDAIDDLDSGDSGSSSGSGGSSGGKGNGSYGNTVEVSKDIVAVNASQNTFKDMAGFEWAEMAVNVLNNKGIVSGREKGMFVPAGSVTRAEFIKMLGLAVGIEPAENYDGCFNDVFENDWYWPYVEAAEHAGIAQGTDGMFMPDQNISREDMAVLLYRACGYEAPENEADIFADSDLISDYAKSAVVALYEKGIILGDGKGNFDPKGNALRAEAAQIIYKMLESK